MKVLKNSSGKVLLTGGKPIQATEGGPAASTLICMDENGNYPDLYYYNSTTGAQLQYSLTDQPITIEAHIGDIIFSGCYSNECEASGLSLITDKYGVSQIFKTTGSTFRVTAANASFNVTCFVGGTKITLADGTLKNIEDITADDIVLGYDGTDYIPVSVLKTFNHTYSGKIYKVSYAEGSFEATGNHPIYVEGDYKAVSELTIGDMLFCDGHNSAITNIEITELQDISVYNLDVSDTNNYIANFCLAHNKPT